MRSCSHALHAATRIACSIASLLAAAALSAPAAIRAQSPAAIAADTVVHGLPLTEVPARRAGDAVAVFLTGDGGFAELDKQVANVLSDSGIGVVALDTRSYLWRKRTPDETAADVARIGRAYLAHWHRSRVLLVGYSHGANLIPFIANRLPADVAPRVALLAMLGLSSGASFQFHFADLFRDIARSTDLPIAPQLVKLRGLPMLCICGKEEDHSPCRDADAAVIARHELPGDHHFDRAYRTIGDIIVAAARR
jgi:type IV secretory pathway VirJ component